MKSWYPGLPAEERLALVQRLFDERKVTESEGLLKYPL